MRKLIPFPSYFFLVKAGLIAISFFLLFNSSCSKKSDTKNIQDQTVIKKEEANKNQTAAKSGDVSPNYVPEYCDELPEPCDDPRCRPYYECEETSLATRIAEHQSFINLNLNFDQALNMPTPNTFTELFDTAQLSSQVIHT